MPGILAITDGLGLRVELKDGPIYIDNWTPAVPGPKNGGIWRNSPLADGRQLAFRRFEHITDSFQLNISTDAMDDTILATRNLRTLLEKAVSYWTAEWQNEPVWIEVRGSCETENRYALIYDYRTPNDDDPFKKPFHNVQSAIESFTLLLEHGPWLALPPGTGECVEISAQSASQYPYHLEFAGGGATDNVDCLSAAALDDLPAGAGFTAEAWVRADGYGGGGLGRIMGKMVAATGWGMWMSAANGLSATIYAPTPALSVSGNDEWTADGEWHHVAMTYADGIARTIYLYIDGVAVVSYVSQIAAVGAYAADGANNFRIGNSNALTQSWDGGIGWLRLSSTVRYALPFTPPPRCVIPVVDAATVGLWISEGKGVTAYNHMATAGTDGTITGATWDSDCDTLIGRGSICAAIGAINTAFISNRRGGRLTHVFYYDASIVTYSLNLLGTALPYRLLPLVFAIGDMIYFGSDTTGLDGGPFSNVVLDIGTAANAITTDAWEYWNGAAWVAIPGVASTRSDLLLALTGVNIIYFSPPAAWATVNFAGINGYVIRCSVTGIGAPSTGGTQQNRDVYTINTPYVETDSTAVLGDIPALAATYLISKIGATYLPNRITMGLRTVDRGDDFTAYINLADTCNPAGLVTVAAGAPSTFQASVLAPVGRYLEYNPGGVLGLAVACVITFTNNLFYQFYGKFRAFLRYHQTGGATGDFQVRLDAHFKGPTYGATFSSKLITIPTVAGSSFLDPAYLDLGFLDIHSNEPQPFYSTGLSQVLTIDLVSTAAAPGVLALFDLILMPVDELALEVIGDYAVNATMFADSIYYPKSPYYAGTLNQSAVPDYMVERWRYIGAVPLQIGPNTSQRLWFLSATTNRSSHLITDAAYLRKVERYLSMRGNQ